MESWGALAHFGHELRAYRERVGLTQAQLGEKVGYGDGLISKIERGERVPQPELCPGLDNLFGTPGSFVRLGQEVRQYAQLTRQFAEYVDRESSATAIHSCCRQTTTHEPSSRQDARAGRRARLTLASPFG